MSITCFDCSNPIAKHRQVKAYADTRKYTTDEALLMTQLKEYPRFKCCVQHIISAAPPNDDIARAYEDKPKRDLTTRIMCCCSNNGKTGTGCCQTHHTIHDSTFNDHHTA